MDRKPILKTNGGRKFEAVDSEGIYLLEGETSKTIWNARVDGHPKVKHRMAIPEEHWLSASPSETLFGCIRDDLEEFGPAYVRSVFDDHVPWSPDLILGYFIARNSIIEVPWKKFQQTWDEFLWYEDEFPILMPLKEPTDIALMFGPHDQVWKIQR